MSANAEATVTLSLVDRVTGPIKRIGARLGDLSRRIGFERIGSAAANLGNKLRGVGDGLARTTGRLASLTTVLGASGAGLIAAGYGLAKSASDVGSEIHDMAAKLGISTEALSEWRHVMNQGGVEAATFDGAVTKLGINAVESAKGNKTMAASFKALGVQVKGAGGKMRPMEDILDDTMLALTKVKDPITRNALAFKLFGKSGAELGKVLADGADGIKAGREEARRLGLVWGGDAADAADAFGDSVTALTRRLTAFKDYIGIQLLPVFTEAVDGINAWFDANSNLIRSTISDWAKTLVGWIKQLLDPTSQIRIKFDELGATISGLVERAKPFVDFLGGPMNAALALIGFWVLAPLVVSILSLAAAFVTLGTAVAGVAASTIGLAISGFGKLFTGMAGTAATTGAAAGATYGSAFSKSLKSSIRVGLLGLGAYAAYQIISDMPTTKDGWQERIDENKTKDAERNKALMDNGGKAINDALGFELTREKDDYANSPAKRLLDSIKGIFSSTATPAAPDVVSSIAVDDARRSRDAGFGKTTENLPGKAKDDVISRINITTPSLDASAIMVPEIKLPDAAVVNVAAPATPQAPAVNLAAPVMPAAPAVNVAAPVMPRQSMPAEAAPVDKGTAEPRRARANSPLTINVPEIKLPDGASIQIAVPKADLAPINVAAPKVDVAPPVLSSVAPLAVPNVVPDNTPDSVSTQTMTANTVTADSAQFAEPIIAHIPQTINAPVSVNVTINAPPGADAAQMASIARREFEAAGQRHADAISSSLSD